MPEKWRKLKWWEKLLLPFFIFFLFIFAIILIFALTIFMKTWGRKIRQCFENDPHTWKTEKEVIAETYSNGFVVFVAIGHMHALRLITERVSEKVLEEDDMSSIEKVRIYQNQLAGKHAFQSDYYEYKWNSQGGRKIRFSLPQFLGRASAVRG